MGALSLGGSSLAAADELRRFRHFLRHAYAAALDADHIARLAASWLSANASVNADLDAFSEFLRRMAESLDASA